MCWTVSRSLTHRAKSRYLLAFSKRVGHELLLVHGALHPLIRRWRNKNVQVPKSGSRLFLIVALTGWRMTNGPRHQSSTSLPSTRRLAISTASSSSPSKPLSKKSPSLRRSSASRTSRLALRPPSGVRQARPAGSIPPCASRDLEG
jgi:hypothetical protein